MEEWLQKELKLMKQVIENSIDDKTIGRDRNNINWKKTMDYCNQHQAKKTRIKSRAMNKNKRKFCRDAREARKSIEAMR